MDRFCYLRFVSFLCILGYFLKSRYRMGVFLWVAKILNIFGVLEIPNIYFWVNGRCWVPAYV